MGSALAKELPHNPDAEKSVLGTILAVSAVDETYLQVASTQLNTQDFFAKQNQVIFAEMRAMAEERIPIDIVSLLDRLTTTMQIAVAGGPGYISQLIDGVVPRQTHFEHHVQIVKEQARRRSIIHTLNVGQQQAFDGILPSDEVAESMKRLLTMPAAKATNGNGRHQLGYSMMDFLKASFPVPEHLVEWIIPKGSSVLIIAMPHHLKSFFTIGLALACTRAGEALGRLNVPKPVRTMLVQVEDPPGVLKDRIEGMLATEQFRNTDPDNLWIVERTQFKGFSDEWCDELLRQVKEFKADNLILDVLRRFFVGRGDLNSSQDTGRFLEALDYIRDSTGCTITLVHHENRKDADLMTASAGSFNLPGWANVIIRFRRKMEDQKQSTASVEIEVDNKLAQSPEPMRMVLDFASQTTHVRMEGLEEGDGFNEAMEQLDGEWTVLNLAEVLHVDRTNAYRRVKKWMIDGKVEKVAAGKRGRGGGMARYREVEREITIPPVGIRHVN